MKIAITGASGYLGSQISKKLKEKHTIFPLQRSLLYGKTEFLQKKN